MASEVHMRTEQRATDSSSGRSRSFGGCATCRSRHMKCDETRPACLMCTNAGVPCGGYEKSIFFDFEGPPDAAALRFRRPLLTERERERMSEWLTSSIPPRLALSHLSQIDDICEETPSSQDIQIYRGPFGAFRLSQPQLAVPGDPSGDWPMQTSSSSDHTRGICSPQGSQDLLQSTDDMLFPIDTTVTPRTRQLFHSFFEQPELEPLSPSMDMWNMTGDSERIQEVFDNIDMVIPDFQLPETTPAASQGFSFPTYISEAPVNHTTSVHPVSMPPSINSSIPHDAVFLVKHYSTTVLRLLTPFRHSKTPWHVLFIPHAKNCLAALTLGEDMDHASLCAFYGTLAISAFSLEGVSQSLVWRDKGKQYWQHAHKHAENMLKIAYDTPKAAKYKSILMALLTMVQISMVSGDREQTECYFLEAEKFIRVKGLNRRKSRKVRLLHHCYAFERMFHESTFVDGINSRRRHHIRKAIESSGAGAYSQDSLSFRLSEWGNLEEEMLKVKGQEEGENDLHLQLPGVWSATLYPEIFAIPERYIFLLSLVIRLGEEKDRADNTSMNVIALKEFLGRAKAVERCINQLRNARQPADATSSQPHVPEQVFDNLLDAMQHALAIYFYRRIYDVDSSLLQTKVVDVRDCLLRFETASSEMAYGSARLIWPAFIAACEAEDPDVQGSFSDWFQSSVQRSGLRYFADARDRVEKIWKQKRNAIGTTITWFELMKTNVGAVR